MSENSSNAQSANARELISRLHDLGALLVNRRTAGMSNRVVPAPEDTRGEHKAAQRRLVNICTMVRPAAAQIDDWQKPIAKVTIPGKVNENSGSSRRGRGSQGWNSSSDESSILQGLPERARAEAQSRFWQMNDTGRGSTPARTVKPSLADLAGWKTLSVPYKRDQPGRAMDTKTVTVEAYLPISFTQAAVTQLWELLDELNLGVPQVEYRPENEMEWDIDEDFEDGK
jgi:hypothetical protein